MKRWLVLSACLGCGAPADPDSAPFRLVFEDAFDGEAGSPPDPAIWTAEVGSGVWGWGNGQLEHDTDRPDNVAIDGAGSLAIVARQEAMEGKDYTSARLTTAGKRRWQYGRFEARMKLPYGQGLWPAFWLLGDGCTGTGGPDSGWPDCGELDIMENRGNERSTNHGSAHGPGYSGGKALTDLYLLPRPQKLSDDFHTFALDWEPESLTFSVDGNAYQTRTPRSLPAGAPWVFDHPFSVLLNLAVGGVFSGSPDETTAFPQTLLVDWVRVYQH